MKLRCHYRPQEATIVLDWASMPMQDIEAIIDQFEHLLARKLTPEERRPIRLAFEAFPPYEDEDDEGGDDEGGVAKEEDSG
jgi:hypothetical protein